ncbi:vitelline membrane outer layer protein 1 homolog [Mercenaria mercenaria]|uniref:vitelline membrane outer layer protein 1 homolog n=1 Tax=Mercenaria mercenaria TaxID=6596 RepID=UPI00234F28AB|nr:vitelline membrane outer layer protein 1 homolog [Mercenaria mercenaria]XP_053402038.1 vitelline membrane outer layer protein 1 homolog [Mercenaria mercenaria]
MEKLNWKRWLFICSTVCVIVIGGAFLYVYLSHNLNKSETKNEAKMDTLQSRRASYMHGPEAMNHVQSNETWTGIEPMTLTDSLRRQSDIELLSNSRVTTTLTVKNGGPYGLWFTPQFCPEGTFANGFNMKYQHRNGPDADNTALNAISLQCADKNGVQQKLHRPIQSAAGHRGQWTRDNFCPKGKDAPLFLQRFALRVQTKKQTGDDTMANEIRFSCRDLQRIHHPHKLVGHIAGAEGEYGQWSKKCPKGSAICGIQTRIEGHLSKGDNTALNDVRFFCCDFILK